MRLHDNGAGYEVVPLAFLSGTKLRYIHRLVAMTFIPNPENLPQVGHKDHNKSNNNVDNLYWCTQSQNTKDGVKAGRINRRGNTGDNKPMKEGDALMVAELYNRGLGVNEIAKELGRPRTTISSLLNGHSKRLHKVFKERLAEIEV